jgi:hypothetical protein
MVSSGNPGGRPRGHRNALAQLRTALSGEETRQQLQITETDWGCFLEGDHRGLVVGVVEHIGYDGKTGAVTVKLGSNGQQP